MKRRIFTCAMAMYLPASLLPTQTIAADFPTLFSVFPEAKKEKQEQRHYIPYPLITGMDANAYAMTDVGGVLSRVNYKLPVSYTPEHIINNHKAQLLQQGASILFECHGSDCGNEEKLYNQVSPLSSVSKREPSMLTAKLSRASGDIYISLYSANWHRGTNLQLDLLEATPEPLDLVKINAALLTAQPTDIKVTDNSSKDARGSADHPLMQRLPGAFIAKYSQQGYAKSPVLTGISGKKAVTAIEEGKLTQIAYSLPRSYSEYEVNANYVTALKKLGFQEVFSCEAKGCISKDAIYYALTPTVSNGNDESQFYSLYRLSRPEGDITVSSYTLGYSGALWNELKIIEATGLNDNRVGIDLTTLTDAITQTGKATLDGLLFDYDSDRMLPESKPVLEVLASYLKQNPALHFYVVGHTDDQGDKAYNLSLSERRAAAVVRALGADYHIKPAQLEAHGMGEFSPVASNANEAGQSQNRRVELVLRSDKK
ncbi:OmpA family protein [Shewanella litorisediminis]|uniref:DUF4892 domain-containing protein n=1 Tax=Shewanella litorisediminis TaxID=1173586 RepID=A0ABX7G535_9GAMM|nr:OmpA family protein [Shewanella litorisediminis]MCL2918029.1 DUF4892 domain-containing protein [Shewanella litorisediminis]QRH02459.1 DUF4892 domain-containing protein [Shewanella litorisediminis]